MKLKTAQTKDATDACKEVLLRGGFENVTYSVRLLRLGGDKPGEVCEALFPPDGYRWDLFVTIHKGTIWPAPNGLGNWDWTNTIILRLV